MERLFKDLYYYAKADRWSGDLIRHESTRMHDTINRTVTSMKDIICSPNATPTDKEWARTQVQKLLGN